MKYCLGAQGQVSCEKLKLDKLANLNQRKSLTFYSCLISSLNVRFSLRSTTNLNARIETSIWLIGKALKQKERSHVIPSCCFVLYTLRSELCPNCALCNTVSPTDSRLVFPGYKFGLFWLFPRSRPAATGT